MSVFDLPESDWLRIAPKHSSNHFEEIQNSFQCACFHCKSLFKPSKLKVWIDDGATAMCPKCHIDSVIGEASGFELNDDFLDKMNQAWF